MIGSCAVSEIYFIGPKLLEVRELPACTVIYDIHDSTVPGTIIVTGGRDTNQTALASVEFFNINSGVWTPGYEPFIKPKYFQITLLRA